MKSSRELQSLHIVKCCFGPKKNHWIGSHGFELMQEAFLLAEKPLHIAGSTLWYKKVLLFAEQIHRIQDFVFRFYFGQM